MKPFLFLLAIASLITTAQWVTTGSGLATLLVALPFLGILPAMYGPAPRWSLPAPPDQDQG